MDGNENRQRSRRAARCRAGPTSCRCRPCIVTSTAGMYVDELRRQAPLKLSPSGPNRFELRAQLLINTPAIRIKRSALSSISRRLGGIHHHALSARRSASGKTSWPHIHKIARRSSRSSAITSMRSACRGCANDTFHACKARRKRFERVAGGESELCPCVVEPYLGSPTRWPAACGSYTPQFDACVPWRGQRTPTRWPHRHGGSAPDV